MVEYLDASRPEIRSARADTVSQIEEQGLLYPVTVIDGTPAYDGAVSYPAILRAVQQRMESTSQAG